MEGYLRPEDSEIDRVFSVLTAIIFAGHEICESLLLLYLSNHNLDEDICKVMIAEMYGFGELEVLCDCPYIDENCLVGQVQMIPNYERAIEKRGCGSHLKIQKRLDLLEQIFRS